MASAVEITGRKSEVALLIRAHCVCQKDRL